VIPTVFFNNANTFLLSDEFPQNIILYFGMKVSGYVTGILLHNMPHLTLQPADRHWFSTSNDLSVHKLRHFCVLILLYIYLHIQCLLEIVVNYVINFILIVSSKLRVSSFAADHLPIRDTSLFGNIKVIQIVARDYDTPVISKYYSNC
jgi:hypothetical protein